MWGRCPAGQRGARRNSARQSFADHLSSRRPPCPPRPSAPTSSAASSGPTPSSGRARRISRMAPLSAAELKAVEDKAIVDVVADAGGRRAEGGDRRRVSAARSGTMISWAGSTASSWSSATAAGRAVPRRDAQADLSDHHRQARFSGRSSDARALPLSGVGHQGDAEDLDPRSELLPFPHGKRRHPPARIRRPRRCCFPISPAPTPRRCRPSTTPAAATCRWTTSSSPICATRRSGRRSKAEGLDPDWLIEQYAKMMHDAIENRPGRHADRHAHVPRQFQIHLGRRGRLRPGGRRRSSTRPASTSISWSMTATAPAASSRCGCCPRARSG